jgi:hypothetical protein
MVRRWLGMAAVAAGAAAAAGWWFALPSADPAAMQPPRSAGPHAEDPWRRLADAQGRTDAAPLSPPALRAGMAAPPAPASLATRFKQATDLLAFVHDLLSAAQAGDRDAQYYVYKALDHCASTYGVHFPAGGDGKRPGLDEVLRQVAQASPPAPQAADDLRAAHARCHALADADAAVVGRARDWLRRAADAGQPLAQAAHAQSEILRLAMSGDGIGAADKAGIDRLLGTALRSRDPEVLWVISDQQAYLAPSGEQALVDQWAWKLLACQRGFDCSASAPWLRAACVSDIPCPPGEDGIGYIRRMVLDDFLRVQARAAELARRLDAGQWAALGFAAG